MNWILFLFLLERQFYEELFAVLYELEDFLSIFFNSNSEAQEFGSSDLFYMEVCRFMKSRFFKF